MGKSLADMAETTGVKTCIRCKVEKSVDNFHRRTYQSGRVGWYSYCRPCNREATRQWTYGLSSEEVEALKQAHPVCAICGKEESVLQVDHNHATGKVRGMLCHLCNKGLGAFGDSSERLERAAAYLHEYGGQ